MLIYLVYVCICVLDVFVTVSHVFACVLMNLYMFLMYFYPHLYVHSSVVWSYQSMKVYYYMDFETCLLCSVYELRWYRQHDPSDCVIVSWFGWQRGFGIACTCQMNVLCTTHVFLMFFGIDGFVFKWWLSERSYLLIFSEYRPWEIRSSRSRAPHPSSYKVTTRAHMNNEPIWVTH